MNTFFFFWWLKIIFFCFSLLRDPLIFLGSTRTKSRLQLCTWDYLPISWDWLLGSFGLESPIMLQSSCLPAIVLWRLAGLRGSTFIFYFLYCSGFCHTLKWNSHGFTCVLHPDPPSHLPLHTIPLGLPSAPAPSACLMHPTWAGDLFHPR